MITQAIPYQDPVQLLDYLPNENLVFLDSSMTTPQLGRYSYIAVDPFRVIGPNERSLKAIETQLKSFSMAKNPELPPFQGGLAGYFSYELAFSLDKCRQSPSLKKDWPYHAYQLGCFDVVISFDHQLKKAWLVSSGFPEITKIKRQERAQQRINWLINCLQKSCKKLPNTMVKIPTPVCHMGYDRYIRSAEKIMDYIRAGDIFQANLARCYYSPLATPVNAIRLYKKLRIANPAPFSALLNFLPCGVLSSSPERFINLCDNHVETRPIKGTIHRSTDSQQDYQLAQQLLASEKDRAENVMIVDLMRNDLSKICSANSIQVPQLCQLESYEKVHHLVSVVTGKLPPHRSAIDLFTACFPGGSITGAPKIRAIEIIDELENARRGPYCGAIGYIGFNGDMQLSITIRSLLLSQQKLLFHSGSAITLASDPQKEYQETQVKAQALKDAIE